MKVLFSNLPAALFCRRLSNVTAAFWATFVLILLGAVHPALADGGGTATSGTSTIGDVMCNVVTNMVPFLDVFNMTAYAASVIFIMQGITHFRNHHEHGAQQYPHHKTFALLTAGTLLTLLPSFIAMLCQTLFTTEGDGSGITSCTGAQGPTSIAVASGSTGLDAMMAKFVNNISDPLTALVSIVAIALGVFLIIRGLMKAARYGNDPRTNSITHILANLIIGCVLISTSQTVDTIMASVFGDAGIQEFSSLKWTSLSGAGDTTQFKAAIQGALTFFQLVGLISFVRGWNIIRNAVEGNGQVTFSQGMTHIIGGVLAMNIYQFMQIMDTTFGTNFVT
jgi:hypothetical protein